MGCRWRPGPAARFRCRRSEDRSGHICIRYWGGIRPDPEGPGFKKISIKPALVGDLTWVKTHKDTPYGRIISNWKREGDQVSMDVMIPPNTTATVCVPVAAKDAAAVTESGKPADKAEGVKFLRMENNAAVYAVGSGTYQFQSSLTEAK